MSQTIAGAIAPQILMLGKQLSTGGSAAAVRSGYTKFAIV